MLQRMCNQKLGAILIVIILICSSLYLIICLDPLLATAEAKSTWTQTSDVDFNKGEADNLTIEGNGEDAELQIDISDLHHWTDKQPTSNPGGRYWHAMATIWNDDRVAIFGGMSGGSSWDDKIWIYDVTNNTWASKSPSTKPSGRRYPAMAGIWNTDNIVLFGGFYSGYEDDTWVYDLSANTWSEKTHSTKPSGRYMHAMASVWNDDKVVLFGGYDSGNFDDETWIYDLSADTWTQKTQTTKPNARYSHTMATVYGDDKVVLFDGVESGGYTDYIWVYDVSDNTWTSHSPTIKPSTRSYTTIASIFGTDKVLLFGGYSSGYKDDTWIYDISDNTWEEIILDIDPGGRYMHTMATVSGKDKVVLYGGYGSGGMKSDTWTYKQFLKTRNGTFVSAPYDTGTNSSFNKFDWYSEVPDNTSIRLQLRTAASELLLNTTDFVGPDGLPGSYYTSSPSNIWFGHHGDRWIQYKVYLNIDIVKKSPSLKDVTISYNCLPETIVVGPANGSLITINKPTFKWTFIDMDSEDQKSFQVQISDSINFKNITFDSGEQTTADELWEFPSGTSYTELPDGGWYWRVRTKDEDGVWTEYSKPWLLMVDTETPSSSPIMPKNNGFYNSLTEISGLAVDPAPGSEVMKVEIAVKDLKNNYYWDGSTWVPLVTWLVASGTDNWTFDSSKIPWLSGNQYNIQSRATDLADHIEVPDLGNTFTIDKDSPVSTIDNLKNNTWLNKLNMLSGKSYDMGGSEVDKVELTIQRVIDKKYWDGSNWNLIKTWLPSVGTKQWSFNSTGVKWSTGYQYLIRSRATDFTKNIEVPSAGIHINYDSAPPDNLAIFINNDEEFTATKSVILSVQADDIGSGVARMAFSLNGKDWHEWKMFNSSDIIELPVGDGEKIVYYKVSDHAGNIGEAVADTIVLDTTPPEKLSVLINNDQVFTNSIVVTLSLEAKDSLSGLDDISFSFDGVTWLPWEKYKLSRTISLPENSADGTKIIYFRARDNAGNVAEPVYDSIILDKTPPQSLYNVINGGALETNSTQVSLSLNAVDTLSGVDQISFSMDNKIWTSWEDYSESKPFELPAGDGEKVIYFRVRDMAGNIAGPVSATIILNTTTAAAQPGETQPAIKEEVRSSLNIWVFLILVVIILIILIAIGAILIVRRKKRYEQELLLPGAMTVKPGRLPGFEAAPSRLTSAPAQPQLLAGRSRVASTQPTQGAQAIPMPAPMQPPKPLPQLPPAQTQTQARQPTAQPKPQVSVVGQTPEPKVVTSGQTTPQPPRTPTVTPKPTPTPRPTPAVKQPPKPPTKQQQSQVTPTPKVAAPPKPAATNGPNVHLPEKKSTNNIRKNNLHK